MCIFLDLSLGVLNQEFSNCGSGGAKVGCDSVAGGHEVGWEEVEQEARCRF